MQSRILKRLIIPIVLGVITYAFMLSYGDLNRVLSVLLSFEWYFLPPILCLSFFNYLLRFLKWEYYLRVLNVDPISRNDSYHIFMSGLSLSITPGKIGEVIKPFLLKAANGTRVSRSIPIVVAERFTDFAAIVFLSSVGVVTLKYGFHLLVFSVALMILVLLLIGSRKICDALLAKISKVSPFKKMEDRLEISYESMHRLLQWRILVYPVILSLFAWFFECLGLYLALLGFDTSLALHSVTFSYAFSTLVGGISLLPGGLGTTEASMTALLILQDVPKELALSGTILIRFCTLWFAVGLGLTSLLILTRSFSRFTESDLIPEKDL